MAHSKAPSRWGKAQKGEEEAEGESCRDDDAIADLGVYGGMSSTVNRDDNLTVTISFDPNTADDGIAGIVAWCDKLEVEYTMTLHRWQDE